MLRCSVSCMHVTYTAKRMWPFDGDKHWYLYADRTRQLVMTRQCSLTKHSVQPWSMDCRRPVAGVLASTDSPCSSPITTISRQISHALRVILYSWAWLFTVHLLDQIRPLRRARGQLGQMQTKVNRGRQEDSNICGHVQHSIISRLKRLDRWYRNVCIIIIIIIIKYWQSIFYIHLRPLSQAMNFLKATCIYLSFHAVSNARLCFWHHCY